MTNIDELENEFNNVTDNLDAFAIVDCIVLVSGTLGIDPVLALQHIINREELTEHESLILEMIEMSQSDFQGSLIAIHRAIELMTEMDALEF